MTLQNIDDRQLQIRAAVEVFLAALPADYREAFALMAIDYKRPAYALLAASIADKLAEWKERFAPVPSRRPRYGMGHTPDTVALPHTTRIGWDLEAHSPGGRG